MVGTQTKIEIPFPDESLLDINAGLNRTLPAPELNQFMFETVLNDKSKLFNPEHIHLVFADVGFVWTNAPNVKHGRRIIGFCEMPMFRGTAWQKARQEQQQIEWFGKVPTFLITLDAHFRAECRDIEFMALFEHELYHAGQARDLFGLPKFSKMTGKPIFAMRGHSIEEHTGVVRRYGIGATGQDGIDFVEAALSEPEIGEVALSGICGTCLS